MQVIDYSPELAASGDATLYTELDAIILSIRSILITPLGSRPFVPEYGSTLFRYVFEPLDDQTEYIQQEIIRALTIWEPRILILGTNLSQDIKNKSVSITVEFKYKNKRFTRYLNIDSYEFMMSRPADRS